MQIELFFKWIKQHLKIKHFYGLSLAAVENQVSIALITYCLGLLLKLKIGKPIDVYNHYWVILHAAVLVLTIGFFLCNASELL